jgi:hypothetical protein
MPATATITENGANRTNHSGHHIFEVRNLAVGGSNSEVGSVVLEYQLIKNLHRERPHVVISA